MFREFKKNELELIINQISLNGFCKVSNVINDDVIEELHKLIENEHTKNYAKIVKNVPDRDKDDKIVYNLQSISKLFIDIISNKFVSDIAKPFLNDIHYRYLEPDLPNYNLTYFNARSSGQKLDLHIDSGIPFSGSYPIAMQFVFLIEDSTEDNGCTVIVPKSHQSGEYTDRSLDLESLVKLTGKKGDVIIWDSRSWHGTLPNKTGRSRWAIIATFARWFIKPQMNIIKTINEDIYRQCSDAQKHLLGFCAIPPTDPFDRVNTKNGYDFLKESVNDYD